MDASLKYELVVGREYPRDVLLSAVGSAQRQSGIIWGVQDSSVVICTSGGRSGHVAGYGDSRQPDGTWHYIGQGTKGDQNESSAANRMLVEGQRTVLLFTARQPRASERTGPLNWRKVYRYEGAFEVAAWDWVVPTEGTRVGDRLLRFHLIPTGLVDDFSPLLGAVGNEGETFEELRARVFSEEATKPSKGAVKLATYYGRSAALKTYVLLRSKGRCEHCKASAPFLKPNGAPFLEVHHILRLSDEGLDHPRNCAALCPNCHRRMHFGVSTVDAASDLLSIVETIENGLSM